VRGGVGCGATLDLSRVLLRDGAVVIRGFGRGSRSHLRKWARVPLTSLTPLETAIRSSWSLWTADPVDQPTWSSANPAQGQCASTALIVQDMLAGQLLLADVHHQDGSRQGVHFWNRLSNGMELDLTREQFTGGEVIGEPRIVERPTDVTRGRLAGQYHLLAARVAGTLQGRVDGTDVPRPVSIKGVCLDPDRQVLLCRNWRAEWELPGGRPELGERFDRCLEREIAEETGLIVEAAHVIDAHAFEVQKDVWVDIVVYGCRLHASDAPVASDEHQAVAFLDPTVIRSEELAEGYARAIAQWCCLAVLAAT
jgi:ADP-ribose pyrophosphatase YjhB (NUDIX family)